MSEPGVEKLPKDRVRIPRTDPKIRRNVSGTAALSVLVNQDPSRYYVLVNKGDLRARGTYDAMGYRYERYTDEHGVRPLGVFEFKKNDVIDVVDAYLMSIPKADKDAMDEEGRLDALRVARQISAKGGRIPFGELPFGVGDSVLVDDYTRREGNKLGAEHGDQ